MKSLKTFLLSARLLTLALGLTMFSGGCSDENSGPGANPTVEDQMKQAEDAKKAMEANSGSPSKP